MKQAYNVSDLVATKQLRECSRRNKHDIKIMWTHRGEMGYFNHFNGLLLNKTFKLEIAIS